MGFYFARKLHEELGVPVGLIESAWAGSGIEPFIPPEGFARVPELVKAATHKNASIRYNTRIHPLIPCAMRGVLWYQGETNGCDQKYALKQRALVEGWRQLWGYDFPFYYVQISRWEVAEKRPYLPVVGCAVVREQQLLALAIPKTGMAVTVDIGGDLHPENKEDVGLRLAQWALGRDYGRKDIVPSGPLYASHVVQGNRVVISFLYADGGLVAGRKPAGNAFDVLPDTPLGEFMVAGEDRVWHPATATIQGVQVVVVSPEVAEPVAVRYAFSQNPSGANLYNCAGLPASPFRTYNWPLEIRQP